MQCANFFLIPTTNCCVSFHCNVFFHTFLCALKFLDHCVFLHWGPHIKQSELNGSSGCLFESFSAQSDPPTAQHHMHPPRLWSAPGSLNVCPPPTNNNNGWFAWGRSPSHQQQSSDAEQNTSGYWEYSQECAFLSVTPLLLLPWDN